MPDDRKIFTVLERSLITRGLGTARPKLVCSASQQPSAYLAVGIPVTRVHVYNANRSLDTRRILSRSVVNDAEGAGRCVRYTGRKGWLVVRQSRSSVCPISRFDVRGCRRPRSSALPPRLSVSRLLRDRSGLLVVFGFPSAFSLLPRSCSLLSHPVLSSRPR